MGKLFDVTSERRSLTFAWNRIRANGANSSSSETRSAIAFFNQDETRNIHRLQKRLRDGTFQFDPQKGITKRKASGGKRGIVMASVKNRIVERAILDRLQHDCQFVRDIINNPYSVGGVPNRSVPHGLKIIMQCIEDGKVHFVRSDISSFFDNVSREVVLKALGAHITDQRFMTLLHDASTVTLGNERALGEDRKLFPTDDNGVAQGSPLSPLFGNILLNGFDQTMNDRGVVCVRFIDDFILLADSPKKVRKAFENGAEILGDLGLKCHDPFAGKKDPNKSDFGHIEEGVVFLGYHIIPGLLQPSDRAKDRLLKAIDLCIKDGRYAIRECIRNEDSFSQRQRYAQTHDTLDRILKGWGNAFAYSNSRRTMEDLDTKLDERIEKFRIWFSNNMKNLDARGRRRAGGICLLSDIKPKVLEDAPFIVASSSGKFRTSAKTLNVYTDGSVITRGKRKGKDQGPGGWGFVVKETDETRSGSENRTTNNRMELQAVIEALRSLPKDRSLKIHTDSQYVCQGVNSNNPVNSNIDLWREYDALSADRAAVKVVWVKAHVGDIYNERADQLANSVANEIANAQTPASPAKIAARPSR